MTAADAYRRDRARAAGLHGIDFIDVSDDQLTLTVHFIADAPPAIGAANIRIDGGRRIRGVRPVTVTMDRTADPDLDDRMRVRVDRAGDFSTYRLCLVEPDAYGRPGTAPLAGFDPRYACADFTFKAACPSTADCLPAPRPVPGALPEPEPNYLAKDYAGFRQLILDRLALTMPGWTDRHVPDVGIALVELLAYAGDQLSYHQDAVATEAYLGTARQRISVRRHALLADYRMHEGGNARAYVHVDTDTDLTLPADVAFLVAPDDPGAARPPVRTADVDPAVPLFHPVPPAERPIRIAHSRIRFYTWDGLEPVLSRGATRATLHGDGLRLRPGDVLILEQVRGPVTGDPADADPAARHAVRLTAADPGEDPVTGSAIVEVCWASGDALPADFPVSGTGPPPACDPIGDITVARGNVILTDHGRWIRDEPLGTVAVAAVAVPCAEPPCGAGTAYTPAPFRPVLGEQPLTFATDGDVRDARPELRVTSVPLAPGGATTLFTAADLERPDTLAGRLRAAGDETTRALLRRLSPATRDLLAAGGDGTALGAALRADLRRLLEPWTPVPDLLSSGPDDRHLVAEIDNEGRAHLRFGDGEQGRRPDANAVFLADYRVGNGPSGNVGADTILRIGFGGTVIRGADLRPRNPLPATGGTAPEPIRQVRLRAPDAFRLQPERAVTAADYARLAERHPAVQRAAGELRWTGSWTEVRVAVDAAGGDAGPELLAGIRQRLEPYRRIGHTVAVVPAAAVPLHVALTVCVRPGQLREPVRVTLRDTLRALFHPDRLTFGTEIHPSRLVAAALAVPGVDTAEVTLLSRLDDPSGGDPRIGPLDVPRLDDDPDFPENGRLDLTLEGGR